VTFNEVLSQTMAMLHQHGRVSYRALKRQFAIPDDYLADLTDAILFAYPQVREEEGRGLVWTGDPPLAPRGTEGAARAPVPLAYTPPYLAEKILTSRSLLAGERKQVTVLFADLKDSTELIRGLDPEAAQQLLDPALGSVLDVEITILDKQSKGVPIDEQANDDVVHLDRFREADRLTNQTFDPCA